MTPEELMAAALIMANKTIENQKLRLSSLTVENQIMAPKAAYFDELVDRNLLTGPAGDCKRTERPTQTVCEFPFGREVIYTGTRRKS